MATAVRAPATTVLYRIDPDDVVVGTGGAWDACALANGGMPPVIGRPLWHFVAGAEVRAIWSHLLRRARTQREAVTLYYRCDGPGIRRLMEMTLAAARDRSVLFHSRLVRTAAAETLLGRWEPGSGRATVAVCGWCGRVGAGAWVEPDEAAERLGIDCTHPLHLAQTICESCEAELRRA